MTEDEFRLPRSSYDLLRQIIKGYGHVSSPAGPKDVADLIGTHRSQVSRNNKFLVSVGVIEGGQKKSMTELGAELARAIDHGRQPEIERFWHELLQDHDFIEKIRTAVKVRSGMERSDLESHIAYTAGKSKSSGVMTGASALVDLMLEGGLLEEADGQIAVPSGEGPEWEEEETGEPEDVSTEGQPRWESVHEVVDTGGFPAALTIELQIQCSPEDLEGLAPKVKNFLEELSEEDPEDEGKGE